MIDFVLDYPYEEGQPVLSAYAVTPDGTPIALMQDVVRFIHEWRLNDPNGAWGAVYREDVTEVGSPHPHYILICEGDSSDDLSTWTIWASADPSGNSFILEGWPWKRHVPAEIQAIMGLLQGDPWKEGN